MGGLSAVAAEAPDRPSTTASAWQSVADRLASRRTGGAVQLGEPELREVLGGTAISFGPAATCRDLDAVEAAAESLGYPLVLKASVPGLLHKTEHDLVRTGIRDREAALQAAQDLARRARAIDPSSGFEVSVQRQLSGTELSIGVKRDSLGALVVVAAGGTTVELLGDQAAAMAPLDLAEAHALLRSLRIWPLLEGYRGAMPADVDAVAQLLVAVGDLAVAVPEMAELDLNPVFATPSGCFAADAACVLAESPSEAARPGGSAALARMLNASRIAVVGGLSGPLKVGSLIVRYLKKHAFEGEIVAVRPNGEVEGVRTHRSIAEIPDPVDMACIAVPSEAVPSVVSDCIAAGIPAGIIFSSGFAEIGDDGLEAQRQIVREADGHFRFLGPNSIGAVSIHNRVFASFGMALEAAPDPGPVGLLSQSGAIASSLLSRGDEFGLSFGNWINVGNEADLDLADAVDFLAGDPRTRVIAVFLEVVRRPAAFKAACLKARAAGKPIVALKTGRSERGREAAASHTGALAGTDVAYGAYLSRCGVLRVDTLAQLFSAVQGILTAGPVRGRRIGLLTMSGGISSILADACDANGLEVPVLPAEVQEQLRAVIPPFGSPKNPVDVTAVGISSPGMVPAALKVLRESGALDLVLIQFTTNADPSAARMAEDLLAARHQPGTPFLVGRLGSRKLAPRAIQVYREGGLHVFDWPDHLVAAAAAAVRYGEMVDGSL